MSSAVWMLVRDFNLSRFWFDIGFINKKLINFLSEEAVRFYFLITYNSLIMLRISALSSQKGSQVLTSTISKPSIILRNRTFSTSTEKPVYLQTFNNDKWTGDRIRVYEKPFTDTPYGNNYIFHDKTTLFNTRINEFHNPDFVTHIRRVELPNYEQFCQARSANSDPKLIVKFDPEEKVYRSNGIILGKHMPLFSINSQKLFDEAEIDLTQESAHVFFLRNAVKAGRPDQVEEYLKFSDGNFYDLVDLAAQYDQTSVFALLKGLGADLNAKHSMAACYAAGNNNLRILKMLKEAGFNVTRADVIGRAAIENSLEALKLLVSWGGRIDTDTLLPAIHGQAHSVIKYILEEHKSSINMEKVSFYHPVANGHLKTVITMVDSMRANTSTQIMANHLARYVSLAASVPFNQPAVLSYMAQELENLVKTSKIEAIVRA